MNDIKIKCEVSQDDINIGTKGSPCWCPVARAIRRYLSENNILYYNVEVDAEDITLVLENHETHNLLMTTVMADKVGEFVDRFDNELGVEPFILEGELELFDDYDGSPRD